MVVVHYGIMPGTAILFSEMTPDASWEDEFNDWYDHEHIPLRMDVPGFRSARRYVVPDTRNYLAIYEMDSTEVLRTPAYQSVKNNPSARTRLMLANVKGFTRYIGEEISGHLSDSLEAPFLLTEFFEIPRERELLLEDRDCLMVRRFRIVDGEPKAWTHLALYYLAGPVAVESAGRCQLYQRYERGLKPATTLAGR
jgi:hypothetical protein